MEVTDYFSLGAVLVALLTLIWQVYMSNEQSMISTFLVYTQRYQSIKLHLPLFVDSEGFELEENNEKDEVLKWFGAYYDMCSEEFFLNESGLVSRKVWSLWHQGITRTVTKPTFKVAWNKLEKNYDAPEFKNFINKIQSSSQ